MRAEAHPRYDGRLMSLELSERLKANDNVSGERTRWSAGRWLILALVICLCLVGLGAAGIAYATYGYAERYEGRILPRTSIAGVDVSGMTRREAVDAVRARIEPELTRRITLSYKGREWTVTPRRLGARSNLNRIVGAAVLVSSDTSFFDKMKMRVLGDRLNFDRSVAIRYPRKRAHEKVEHIAGALALEPRDASIDYSSGWVEFTEDRVGRSVRVDAMHSALMRALRQGRSEVPIPVRTIAPDVTADAYDQVLLVRIGENRLYLYEDGKVARSWPVATGQPEYMTPTGLYEITEKRYLPTWINPAPDTWGKDMPRQIPPGPGNPLGVRALNWSAPAIRFHGTDALYSLGYNASHGCVRLSNTDVVELYDTVDVGTPIASVIAGALDPLYVSSPDPTPVADNEGDGGAGKNKRKKNGNA
ncbi:MAG TPA: L,D-transpeptidase/peptidoglycan binding protein [Actinomycetota bacterium]|jgi:hypothetical protein|nr:L,D-transpeptidase/peptidoglycan binding protein [Actinomycetota bacterium]